MAEKVLCIGIGNPYRQDDSVGLRVAEALRQRHLPDVKIMEHSGEGVDLMEAWQGAKTVILVDAVSSNAVPGTLFQFAVNEHAIPANYYAYSTHAFGLESALELARLLDQLPPCCIVFGIEGQYFDYGPELSPEVEAAVPKILPRIIEAIRGCQGDC